MLAYAIQYNDCSIDLGSDNALFNSLLCYCFFFCAILSLCEYILSLVYTLWPYDAMEY